MKTELDIHNYQCWYLENMQYRDRLLTLTVEESSRVVDEHSEPKTYLIVFSDTIQFQVYDETDHHKDYHLDREIGVIAKYKSSSLLNYLRKETLLFDTTPGDLFHYSVMTGNEFIHVLTREKPKIINVT